MTRTTRTFIAFAILSTVAALYSFGPETMGLPPHEVAAIEKETKE